MCHASICPTVQIKDKQLINNNYSETQTQILEAATACFASRGFYGTSIALIVENLPFTKQTLLHHFGSKEKLYGEVLKGISERLTQEFEQATITGTSAEQKLEQLFILFLRRALDEREETQLICRELLDNQHRAESAHTWYLKPFLEKLAELLASAQQHTTSLNERMTMVYQIIGAINFFVISEVTLTQMFNASGYREMTEHYEKTLKVIIKSLLADKG